MIFLSFRYREGISHLRDLWPTLGEKGHVRGSFLHVLFLRFFQFKIFGMPNCHMLGPVCSKPCQLPNEFHLRLSLIKEYKWWLNINFWVHIILIFYMTRQEVFIKPFCSSMMIVLKKSPCVIVWFVSWTKWFFMEHFYLKKRLADKL